ncbi:MAG: hypothetical protein AB7N65_29020 [Vicinamibacterales bacterium]
MSETPATPEVAEFVANLLRATRKGAVDWRLDEFGEERTLTAELGSSYTVCLRLVPDFERQSDEPDHVLTLSSNGNSLFDVDRRDVNPEDLSSRLEDVRHPYAAFNELWKRALAKALQVSDHLDRVNRFLKQHTGS